MNWDGYYMYIVLKSSSEIAVNDLHPLYLKFSRSQIPLSENDGLGAWFENLEICEIKNILGEWQGEEKQNCRQTHRKVTIWRSIKEAWRTNRSKGKWGQRGLDKEKKLQNQQ